MFELLFKYTPEDFERSEIVLGGPWPAWLVAALAVTGVVLLSVFLARHARRAPYLSLASVWLLQAAMLATALLVLMQPTLLTREIKPGENTLAAVADISESMVYSAGRSRLDTAIDALTSVIDDAQAIGVTAQRYVLAEGADRVESFAGQVPDKAATRLGDALLAVLDDARSRSLAAVVLASDGIDTAGGLSTEQLAEIAGYGVPVHTIGTGRESMPEDIELTQVLVPGKALPSSTVSARVSIRHDGPGTAQARVYDGDELLASVPVELPPDATTTTAWLNLDLDRPGRHLLRFSVDSGDEEPETRNNRRAALVEVADQRYRVLYFEGEPRWEYKFMRRALDEDEDIAIVSLLRVSANKFYRQGLDAPDELSDGFPESRDALFRYDALVIGSVEAASFSDAQLGLIRDFVNLRGGSLLMLAGPSGLGSGGWGQSAIAELLPSRLPASSSDSFFRNKVRVSLTPQGADLPMLRLAAAPEDNRRRWQELPEVADYQLTGPIKPAAMVLLDAETAGGPVPLLLTQPYGRGHSYILATGGTWRWQMSMPLEDMSHETFWRQFLRTLVTTTPPAVSLTAAGGSGGSDVRLRAEFRDESFDPVEGLIVRTVVSHEDGDSWVVDMEPSAEEAGVFTASAAPTKSGSWYFEAIAERDGEPVHTARSSLYSETSDQEYFNIRRNTALLRRLAEATGGEYFEAGETGALAERLRYSAAGITETIRRPLWDAPAFFLLLLLLKSAEWLLRRRWNTI